MKNLCLLISCFLFINISLAQSSNETSFHKWGVSAHIGANTTSTNSSYASVLDYNWSIGILRNFETKKELFEHRIKFKIQAFNETLKKLPYYSLDANNNLVASSYMNKGMYSMLYLGWGANYILPTKSKALSVKADLGFNFLLPARYVSIYSNGAPKGIQSYGRPNNYFFTRPEVSVGIGYKLNMGSHELVLTPFYSFNFTVQYLNLIPSFHSVGFETTFNF